MAYTSDSIKKYVDYAGLKYYDELIKKFIKEGNTDAIDKLIALIGAAEKGADEKTVLARIADLETAVGDVSELGEDVANLTKAILGESARAKGVEGTLTDLTTEAKTNLVAAINEVDAHADAAQADVDALEKLVGFTPAEGEDEPSTVIEYVDAEVAKVNSVVDSLNLSGDAATSAAVAGITVKVEETKGQISKPVVSVTPVTVTAGGEQGARTLAASDDTSVMVGSAVAQIKKYSDETLADAIAALDVVSNDSAKVAGIQIGVTEVDGKVQTPSLTVDDNEVKYVAKTESDPAKVTVADTAAVLKGDAVAEIIKYVDAMDAAGASDADERLDALEATHAKKEDGSFKTVAEEAAEATAKIVDGAPESLDTLKEIAAWIANKDENNTVTDAASIISRVDILTGADTVSGSVAKAEKDAKAYTDAEIAKLDSTATDADKGVSVSAAIEDGKLTETGIDVAITAATVTYTAHVDAAEGQEAAAPNLAVTANEGNVLTSESIAAVKSYVDDTVALANKGADEAIKALDATVNQNGISSTAAGTDFQTTGLQLFVEEEDGKLKSVNGSINTVTEADIAALFEKAENPTA